MTGSELRGWKEISTFLKVSARTVQRWEAELQLPIHRLAGDKRGTVWAIPDELRAWRTSIDDRMLVEDQAAGQDGPHGAIPENGPAAPGVDETAPAAGRLRKWIGWRGGVVVLLALAVAMAAWMAVRNRANPHPQAGGDRPAVPEALPDGNAAAGGGIFSQRRIILIFTDDQGAKFTVRVPDGSMTTTAIASVGRFGVVATLEGATLNLGIARLETINGRDSVRVTQLAEMRVNRGATTSLHSLGFPIRVEWTAEDEAKVTPGVQDDADHRCCLTCQPSTVCGQQVDGPCGSCRALATLGAR